MTVRQSSRFLPQAFIEAKFPVVVILAGLAKLQQGANLTPKNVVPLLPLEHLSSADMFWVCIFILFWIYVPIWVLQFLFFLGASKAARRDAPAGVENC